MRVTHGDHNGVAVVEVHGEVDIATAPELEAALVDAVAKGPLLVDLTQVGFIDSTGLRALLTANEAADAAGAKMTLIVADGAVPKLFSITGVDKIFTTADSRDAAVADG